MSNVKECICGICPGGCAVQVEVDSDNHRIRKIRPSKSYPFGALCLRGSKADAVVNAPDRLLTPKIRIGKKGEGKFRDATWDEALDAAAQGFLKIIRRDGAQAIASHIGRGTFEPAMADFVGESGPDGMGIFRPLGCPNDASVGSLCYNSFGVFAPLTTMGLVRGEISPDLNHAERIVVWGTNPPAGSPPFVYQKIRQRMREGCPVVTIDHYESEMAKQSDRTVLIRSGTDGALIWGIIRYLYEHGRYDREFVENYTLGFEALLEEAGQYTLSRTASITGVPEEDIIFLAEYIAKEKTTLVTYTGLEYSNCGVQTIRAVYCLWALAGHMDRQGGLLLNRKPARQPSCELPPLVAEPFGSEDFRLFTDVLKRPQFLRFPEAVLEGKPYRVSGLLNMGSVISVNYPNSARFEEALRSLEHFVVVDRFMTKDCLYADVILPASTYFEEESYAVYPGVIRKRERLFNPLGEAKNNYEILHLLADRMGYGEYFAKDADELLSGRFAAMPQVSESLARGEDTVRLPMQTPVYESYRTGGLRSDGKPGFPTPSGRFEFTSSLLEEYGFEPLPIFRRSSESPEGNPELAKDFPLIFNSGARIQTTFRTQHLNIDALCSIQDKPYVLMNPETAHSRNISDGDSVILSTARGEIPMTAKLIPGILPGEVEVNVGGGSPGQSKAWAQANVNYLTDDKNVDPISGFPVFKNLLCDIRKA